MGAREEKAHFVNIDQKCLLNKIFLKVRNQLKDVICESDNFKFQYCLKQCVL